MSPSLKILTIVLIISATFFYAHYEKKKFEGLDTLQREVILKSMPDISFKALGDGAEVNQEYFKQYKGSLVHFWGTWCAPCEVELPEFIRLAWELEPQGVKVMLLAVKDEDKKIKKFMRRFGNLPPNVIIVHDQEGKSMDLFGTVKVPETYLFNRNLKHLKKFIGPQDWKKPYYKALILDVL